MIRNGEYVKYTLKNVVMSYLKILSLYLPGQTNSVTRPIFETSSSQERHHYIILLGIYCGMKGGCD
jgi:hypothetical protein